MFVPSRTDRLKQLRQQVAQSVQRRSKALVGARITESGVLDRAVLNEQIDHILERAVRNPSLGMLLADQLEAFINAVQESRIPRASAHLATLLSLESDHLRQAALLSLMVRMAGKRKFDEIAAYVLQNRAIYVTA